MHRRLTECDFGRRFVCLTFDDGYRDNLEFAYPILREAGFPFAVYVPTSFPDRLGELWWLVLEAVIAKRDRIGLVIEGENRSFDCAPPSARIYAWAGRRSRCWRAILWSPSARTRSIIWRWRSFRKRPCARKWI